jgi:hypothetical protein
MPFSKRGKNRQYFYEHRRDNDGQIKKHYIGRQNSLEASIAFKKEAEYRRNKEKADLDKKLESLLVNKFHECQNNSNLLLRSELLQVGLYVRGSEIRKIRRNK